MNLWWNLGLDWKWQSSKKKDKYDERNDKTMIMKMTAGKKMVKHMATKNKMQIACQNKIFFKKK